MITKLKFKTAEQCWRLVRHHVEVYQRRTTAAEQQGRVGEAHRCRAARNALDRVALTIRYGYHKYNRKRRKPKS